MISVLDREENIVGKGENAVPAFPPFPAMFSKAFLCSSVKTKECLGKVNPYAAK